MNFLAEFAVATDRGVPAGCVSIDYINWRGERSTRRIVPQRLYLGAVEWHPGTQWLLDAWDVDKQAVRSFAMKDVKAWTLEGEAV